MAFTYNPSTNRGKVRLMIMDIDENNAIFQDAEIDVFLSMHDNDLRLAAAQALDAIAANQVYVLKVVKLLDTQVDGAKVAAELRAQANGLREQVENEVDFDWAETAPDMFSTRELIYKDALRTL